MIVQVGNGGEIKFLTPYPIMIDGFQGEVIVSTSP